MAQSCHSSCCRHLTVQGEEQAGVQSDSRVGLRPSRSPCGLPCTQCCALLAPRAGPRPRPVRPPLVTETAVVPSRLQPRALSTAELRCGAHLPSTSLSIHLSPHPGSSWVFQSPHPPARVCCSSTPRVQAVLSPPPECPAETGPPVAWVLPDSLFAERSPASGSGCTATQGEPGPTQSFSPVSRSACGPVRSPLSHPHGPLCQSDG